LKDDAPGGVKGLEDHIRRTVGMLDAVDCAAVLELVEKLHEAYERGKRVFIFGNGGSAATASHFAEDLAKSTVPGMETPKRLRVQSLADSVPFISALGNDWGYETVFREQLVTNAEPGDIAIAISGSGNSPNVVRAIEWGRANGLFTCGFTGFGGGKLKEMVHLSIHTPIDDMEIAENCHMIEVHLVVGGLRRKIRDAAKTRT
jgi:D-sedoheptulose 7-phosphate isomerase